MRRGTLLAILLLSSLLRLYGLGRDGFWFDEATTILVAEKDIGSLVRLCSGDNVPPLYYLVLHFWLYGGGSEAWVRLLSVAFGVATVWVVWRLGNRLAGYPSGAYSALLVALSPANIAYSQEARMYAMVGFFAALSFSFLCAWLQERRGRQIAGYVVCAVAALYTHIFSLFILLAQNAYVLLFSGIPSGRKARWLLSQACIGALFVPWALVVARQVHRIGEDFWLGRITPRAFLSLWPYLGTGGDLGDNYPLAALLNLPLIILLCIGLFALYKRRPPAAEVLATWLFVPVALAGLLGIFFPIWLNRYLLIVSPAYALIVGSAIAGLRGRLRALVAVLVVLILAVSLNYQYAFVSRTRVKQAMSYVDTRYRPGDCIIHYVLKPRRRRPSKFDDDAWATFSYFPSILYHRGRYPEFLLSREDVPFYLRGELIGAGEVVSDFARASAGYRRVWLVSWGKSDARYDDGAALELAGPEFRQMTSLRFPSPGNDTVTVFLLERLRSGSEEAPSSPAH